MYSPHSYVIGLDGGGTKTTAELCRTGGEVLAELAAGPSNFQIIGVEAAAVTLLDLIQQCCRAAQCSPEELSCAVAGLTGAGRPADQDRMTAGLKTEALRRGLRFDRFVVESDARIALEGAHEGRSGIIVIAGTGSIVFGKDADGGIHRAGGWGRIVGDEGGGYTIGRLALRAIGRDLDGREKTTMTAAAAAEWKLNSPESIIRAVYKEGFDPAALVPLVLTAAQRRDRAACAILSAQAKELAQDVRQVARKIQSGRGKIAVAFTGSIAAHTNFFSAELRKSIRAAVPRAAVVRPRSSPVHGAVLLGLRQSPTQLHPK